MSKTNSAIAGAGAGSAAGPWGAAIGGVAGYLMGSDEDGSKYQEDLLRQAQNIPLPILKEYYPELYKSVVQINPELETAFNLGPSEMQGISTDPTLKQAQMNALMKLQGIGEAGGRDAQFMADASRLENDVNTNLQGQTGAISQNLAARGMSGGGSEMVAKNIAAQGAANRQGQMAMDLNAQAQQRALQALMQSGQLGGQMDAQSFQQQSAKAQAADAINKFNTQNQQQTLNNNVGYKNNAQQLNASNMQSVSDKNVGLNNQQQIYNSQLGQQDFENRMKKIGMSSGPSNALSSAAMAQQQQQDQFAGNAIGAGARSYANWDSKNSKKADKDYFTGREE